MSVAMGSDTIHRWPVHRSTLPEVIPMHNDELVHEMSTSGWIGAAPVRHDRPFQYSASPAAKMATYRDAARGNLT